MSIKIDANGFDDLGDLLKAYAEKSEPEALLSVLQAGANTFVDDLKHLPKPRSQINAAGHKHLLDSFKTKNDKEGVLVGWGVYYGPIIERGWTMRNGARHNAMPHLKPTWTQNKERYYKVMVDLFHGN